MELYFFFSMCGFFGFILPPHSSCHLQKSTRVFEQLFSLSDYRGKEASGVALWSDKKLSLLKAPIRGKTLIAEKKYQDLLQDTLSQAFPVSLIGHSRLETNGSHTLNKNNQPVHAGSMTAIHNGII